MDHVFIGIYILEKKKINVVKSEKKNYLIPEKWIDKDNCYINEYGIFLDSLEVFQIVDITNQSNKSVSNLFGNQKMDKNKNNKDIKLEKEEKKDNQKLTNVDNKNIINEDEKNKEEKIKNENEKIIEEKNDKI